MNDNTVATEIRRLLEQGVDLGALRAFIGALPDDPGELRFSVDAALIGRLGRELVGKEETAVAELIKNAYDADAVSVELTFRNTDLVGGSLLIEDDGDGMDRAELVNGFMRLSTTEKLRSPTSPTYQRRRAGSKGIGRFAVQRLGQRLVLTTQKQGMAHGLRLHIDWSRFEPGRELTDIPARLESVEKTREKGTSLEILDLREAWSEASLKRVYRYVAELVQPTPLSSAILASETDPGFDVQIYRQNDDNSRELVADQRTEILEHALAEIEGYVDAEGFAYWSVESRRFEVNDRAETLGRGGDHRFVNLRGVHLRAHYFIHSPELVPRSLRRVLREVTAEHGGIRVYRNGFRVRPYGERSNDWLGLEASTRAREIFPPHANNNFVGFVELIDPGGAIFEETSSREGLIENAAFSELQAFVRDVLRSAVLRIAEARGRKQRTGQKDWTSKDQMTLVSDRIKDVATSLAAFASNAPNLPPADVERELDGLAAELRAVANRQEAAAADLLHEVGMLRVLASLGLVIAEFTHEIKQTLGAAVLRVRQLGTNVTDNPTASRQIHDLNESLERINSYAAYFDRTVSQNAQRELAPQDLMRSCSDFQRSIQPVAARFGINVEDPEAVSTGRIVTCPMHPSELASVLYNFFSNSVKAIRLSDVRGAVKIRIGRDAGQVYLDFLDNGIGVPTDLHDRIFHAFFTTSRPVGDDIMDYTGGSGLGLKIVRDIAEAYDGSAYLTEAEPPFVTSIRFEIRSATDEELEEYEG